MILVKAGISGVSVEGAMRNLDAEISGGTLTGSESGCERMGKGIVQDSSGGRLGKAT